MLNRRKRLGCCQLFLSTGRHNARMQVLSMPRTEVSQTLRRQGGTMAAYADVVDRSSGDTLGEALWTAQVQRRQFMATKQRSLWTGLAGIGLLTADMALNNGAVGTLHVLGRLGGMLASIACIAHGGMTGDKVDAAQRQVTHLGTVARELRALGGGGDVKAQAEVAARLGSGATTRAEMLDLVRATEASLLSRPESPKAVLEQVRDDRKVLEKLTEGDATALRSEVSGRAKLFGKLAMAGLIGGGVSALSAMVGLGPIGVIAMGTTMGLGVVAQDRRDTVLLQRDVIDRWELQVADLKGLGAMASGGPTGGTATVGEHFVQLGGVRVPVRVKK